MRHHTNDKGDLGIAKAHADLVSKGFTVLFPATEHAPFDLVAYADGEFHRLCIYCPETDECYYVQPDAHGASVTLRIAPSKNGQQAGVLDAAAFRELPCAVLPLT